MKYIVGLMLIFVLLSCSPHEFISESKATFGDVADGFGAVKDFAEGDLDPDMPDSTYKDISILGIGEIQTIKSDKIIRLSVKGSDNNITIDKDTVVESVYVGGIQNTVYLYNSSDAKIDIKGLDSQVIRT